MNHEQAALIIHSSFSHTEVALSKAKQCSVPIILASQHASSQLVPAITTLLQSSSLQLTNLAFIGVNAGPGPFTSLRTVIATANGLYFATHLPLVAVNGIETFVREHKEEEYTHTFAILNAFGNDVYYAHYQHKDIRIDSGYINIEDWIAGLVSFLQHHPHARIKFIGNACSTYQQRINSRFETPLILTEPAQFPSLTAISQQAWKQWETKEIATGEITPLYLKLQAY